MLEALTTRWAGRGRVCYEARMPSTNLRAREMARQGAPHGSLAVCDDQTAGRGRMQRVWKTPPGLALTHSLVLRPRLAPQEAQLITLAAAVASAQAIEDVCPQLRAGIKWPNDVLIGSGKCVGILCEAAAAGDELAYIIAGVGINVNQTSFPEELSGKATSLRIECGRETDRWALLCAYLQHMEDAVDALETQGLPGILDAYTRRSVTLGHTVRILSPTESYVALACAIDQTGALLVKDEQGAPRRVLCGDVSVRGLMGYCE